MFKHKIFELLKSFSEDEIARFGDFIDSRCFNRSRKVFDAYKFIYAYYPGFKDDRLTRENLYRVLFKSGKYNDSSIRNVFSKLLSLGLKFLAFEKLNCDALLRNNLILEDLLRRGQSELFIKVSRESEKKASGMVEVDFDYLLNRYMLERNKFNFSFYSDKIIHKEKVFPQVESMGNAGIYLTIYFITELISEIVNVTSYAEKYNAEEVLNSTVSIILQSINKEKILGTIKGRTDKDYILELYICMLEAFTNLDKEMPYKIYKNLILKNSKRLSHDEISFHYTMLISYCILKGKLRGYPEKNTREQLALYNEFLAQRYFKNKKTLFLSENMYRDILLFYARLNKPDLMKNLINDFSSMLQPKAQENMKNFSYSYYYYKINEYEKSLEFIGRIKIDYFIYKYDVKSLQLRVYYERGFFEEAISLIHSFREQLRKDDFLLEARKIRLRNFINYTRRLIIYKLNGESEELESLSTEIKSEGNASYMRWLMEKLNQLEK
jgi:hypothetical protein